MLFAVMATACDRITDDHPDEVVPEVTAPEKQAYPIGIGSESFERSPETVVSLSPVISKIISDIGMAQKLVGVTDYCEVEGFERIGSAAHPDVEKIRSIKPELIITLSPIASSDKVILNQEGIRILELSMPHTFAELCSMYINLSMLFYGRVDSLEISQSALLPLDTAMSEAKKLGISKTFLCVKGFSDSDTIILSHKGTIESDILSVFGENLNTEEKFYFDRNDVETPDVIYYNSMMSDRDVNRMFDVFGDKTTYIAVLEDFLVPSASLCETVTSLSKTLSGLQN